MNPFINGVENIKESVDNAVTTIGNRVGDAFNKATDTVGGAFDQLSTGVQGIVGDGTFTGINGDNIQGVLSAINGYIDKLTTTANGINIDNYMSAAFKGKMYDAATNYAKQVKELIIANINKLKYFQQALMNYRTKIEESDTQRADSANTEAESVQKSAQQIMNAVSSIRID